MSDKEDGEVLSEGELEDGELPSSDEEDDTAKDKEPLNPPKSPPSLQAESEQHHAAQKRPLPEEEAGAAEKLTPEQKKPKLDASPTDNTEDAEDGEIFSDDEEAAYYPQLVKSRPSENQANSENIGKSGETATSPQDERRWGRRRRDSIEEKCGENIYVTSGYHSRRDKSPLDIDDLEGNKSSDNDSSGRERDRNKKRDYRDTSSKSYQKSSRYTGSRDRDSDYDDQEDGENLRGQYSYKGRKGYSGGRFYQSRQQRYGGRSTRQWDQNQSRGGYGTQPAPGQMNTGMTARQFHYLASKVAKRRERGLSLLPNPDVPICNNLDQFNYPAPPSWYLEAEELWEKKMKEREEGRQQDGTEKDLTQEASVPSGGDGVSSIGENRAASPDPKTLPSLMQLPLNLPLQQPLPLVQVSPSSQETVVQPVKEFTPVDLSDEIHQPPEDMDIEVSSQDEEEEISQLPPKDLDKNDNDEDKDDSSLSRPLPRKSIDSEQDVDDFDYDMYLDQLVDEEEEDDTGGGPSLTGMDIPPVNAVTNKADSTTNSSLKSLFKQDHPSVGLTNKETKDTNAPHVKPSDQSLLKEGVNPLSEDFPLIDPSNKVKVEVGMSQKQSGSTNQSLKALVGQDIDMVVAADEGKEGKDGSRRGGVKSNRRKQKETVWWAKQKEKEALANKRAEETAKIPCKYFVAGFCKHGENCQYSHDIAREKKKDICKFYLQDSCTKGDDCLYYHGAFPCKFYHTKTFCKHGDKCRFSHAPLTPETRDLLMTVLEPSKDFSKLPELPVSTPSPATGVPIIIPPMGGASVHGGHTGSLHPYTDHQRQYVAMPMSSAPAMYPMESRQQKDEHWGGAGSSVEPIKLDGGRGGGGGSGEGEGFIVSIPKHIATNDSLIVSIPLSKVRTKVQNILGNAPPPSHPPQPTLGIPQFPPAQPYASTVMYQPPPQVLPQVSPQPPVPFQFQQTGIGMPQQPQPVPLFPPKTTSPTTGFPPTLNPPSGGPNLPPPFQQRKGLLPTPPPHFKLTPEDWKRMESTNPEYWEAPELSQYGQPQPPQYAQPQPHPPQYDQLQPHPPHPQYDQPHPPQYAGTQYAGTQYPAQPQESYSRAPPPGGIPTAPDQYSMPPPSQPPPPPLQVGEDPRQNMRQLGADPRQGRPTDFRPMEPHPPHNVIPPDPRAFVRPQLPPPNVPQPGMNPVPGPRVRMERGQHPSVSGPPVPSFQPPQHQTVGFTGPPHGLSPSFGGGVDYQPAQTHVYPHSQPPSESYSSVWGSASATSPERPATSKPEVVASSLADPRRIDPRTKYAHLKIKPKNQSSPSAGHPSSHSILKKGQVKEDKSPDKTDKHFTIPKLLKDPSALDKPLDPRELFSGSTESDQEYGEIRAPFGTFGSYFSRAQEGSHSPKGSQQFGEITLNANTKQKAEEHIPEKESHNQKESPTPPKDVSSPTKPHVPSYLAQLNLELDNDLKIDSAFSSLEEKSKGEESSGSDSKQKLDTAKKLPSIFGFGL